MSFSGIPEVVGWIGAVMYIAAYLLLTIGKLSPDSSLYHLMNILGATGLIVNAVHFSDYPNVVTNLLWLGIGLYAVAAIAMRRRRNRTR